MKKRIASLLLLLALLLPGCSTNGGDKTTDGTETENGSVDSSVTDVQSNTDTGAESSESYQNTEDEVELDAADETGLAYRYSIGFNEDAEYTYDGGVMSMTVNVDFSGTTDAAFGFLIFIDGVPQPYFMEDDPEYDYMKYLYPTNGEYTEYEVFFTPVTGTEGDTLEVSYMTFFYQANEFDEYGYPTTFCTFTSSTGNSYTHIHYTATPPEITLPTDERLVSYDIFSVAMTEEEIAVASKYDPRDDLEFNLSVDGISVNSREGAMNKFLFSVTGEETLAVSFEYCGAVGEEMSLVVFLDNVPILIDGEDFVYVTSEDDTKVIVEMEIDISDFDGKGSVYAVLVPRCYGDVETMKSGWIEASDIIYLTSASSYGELSDSWKASDD